MKRHMKRVSIKDRAFAKADFIMEYIDPEELVDDLIRAMSGDEANEYLDYIIQNHGLLDDED